MDVTTDLDEMVTAYVAASLWAGLAEYPESEYASMDPNAHYNPEPLDDFFSPADISADDLATITRECQDFAEANAADLADMDAGQVGHDFYLTRNGHGAGFWDRGLGELGDRLTRACEPYGESALYGFLIRGEDGEWTGEGIELS
jgi:hypothetical protein